MLHDMHFHTINSDGNTKLDQLIDFLQDKKSDFLFLSPADHDIVSRKVVEIIKKFGIPTCEATEISAKNYQHDKSIHLTLYAKSITSRVDQILNSTREQKILMIIGQIEHLNKFGFDINLLDFYRFSCLSGKDIVGINRFDIARYILYSNNAKNNIIKINGGLLSDSEIYDRYLKSSGDKYEQYGVKFDDYEPGIDIIAGCREECNGILSIAHPNITFKGGIREFAEVLPYYKNVCGVNAIEINTKASKEWVQAEKSLGEKHGLYFTFGSDNHDVFNCPNSQGNLGELNPNLDVDFVKRSFDNYNHHII